MTDIVDRLRKRQAKADSGGRFDDAEALCDAADEIERLRAVVPEWRPIATAPKDGTEVLLWVDDWRSPRTGWAFEGDAWQAAPPCVIQPTHWMPLPAAPPEPTP